MTVKDSLNDLEAIVERERTRFHVPGAAVGVVYDGELVAAMGSGTREFDLDLPVTPETIFAIGSCTKAMTACTLARLVDEGLLEWDRPIREYFQSFELADAEASARSNLVDLLSHRTGVPRHDFAWIDHPIIERIEFLRRLKHLRPSADFRETWQYNNLMYVVAGCIAGLAGDGTWETTIRSRLFDPLNMPNSNTSVTHSKGSPNFSKPHRIIEGIPRVIDFRTLDLVAPCGGVNSCVLDLSKWLMLSMDFGSFRGQQLVSRHSMMRMQEPAMAMSAITERTEHPDLWPEARTTSYGLGWFLGRYRSKSLVGHAGNIDGFSASISFLPDDRLGVIALSNLDETPLCSVLTYAVIDSCLGLAPLPWGERYETYGVDTQRGIDTVTNRRRGSAVPSEPSHSMDSYQGVFSDPGYGEMTVGSRESELFAELHSFEFSLEHRHFDIWSGKSVLSPHGTSFSFRTGFDGTIDAVEVGLEPALDPILFRRQPNWKLGEGDINRLVGVYILGPITAEVMTAPHQRLFVSITGRPTYELHRDASIQHRFRIGELPNAWAEFEMNAGSNQAVALLVDPWGRFARNELD